MAMGKKPTREQRKMIEAMRLDAHNWLVLKDTTNELVIKNKFMDTDVRTINKEWLR